MVVTVGRGHRVVDLAEALGCRETLYLGPFPLPMSLPLEESGVMRGSVLGVDRPAPAVAASAVGGGIREVAVVGGLHGGPSTTLYPSGTLIIGRGSGADLVLADAEVSRRHARLVIAPDGDAVRLEDAGSRNGIRWRGWLLEGPTDLAPGDVAGLGETVVGLRDVVPADADLDEASSPAARIFRRQPRAASPVGEHHAAAPVPRYGALEPDPTLVVALACAPSARLWERRPSDRDFLRLRLGLWNHLVHGAHDPQEEGSSAVVHSTSVAVNLGEVGVLGIRAPRAALLAMARALVAQAAVLHAPQDLAIVVITGQDGAADWEWVAWLPHTRPPSGDFDCSRLVATDAEQARSRLAELRGIVHRRSERRRGSLHAHGQTVLAVVDGVRRLHGVPGLADVLTDGPPVGVHVVCLAEPAEVLPPECLATLVATGPAGTRGRLSRREASRLDELLLDGLDTDHATRLALALAPITLVDEEQGEELDVERLSVHRRRFTELGRPPRDRAVDAAGEQPIFDETCVVREVLSGAGAATVVPRPGTCGGGLEQR